MTEDAREMRTGAGRGGVTNEPREHSWLVVKAAVCLQQRRRVPTRASARISLQVVGDPPAATSENGR
jgi:hypothetical protein